MSDRVKDRPPPQHDLKIVPSTTTADGLGDHTQELLHSLMEGVPDAIYMLDPHGNVVTWNSGALRMKQYTAEEIVGRHFSIFYLPEQVKAGVPQDALDIANRHGTFRGENWRIRKDKTVFWASVTITALRNPEGSLVGYVKITRDLSELKAAQESIERSDARFSGIVKISEDAIISMDERQIITLFNDGAEKIFGYTSAEMVGQKISILIPPRFLGAHDGYIRNFSSSHDSLRAMNERGSIFGLRRDGTEFPAEASISKFEVGGEKVLTVRLRDITERKRAEEAIKRSEARFAGIVRISEDAIISVDHEQRITLFNEGAEKVFGYTSDEVIGKRINMLIPSRFAGVHDGYIKNFSSSPDALRPMNDRGSIFGLRKDGSEFPAEASISKFEVGGDKVLTVRLRDITDRKKNEEQIRKSLEEKEILLKEIHHRVKNNLQVVSSLLNLQSDYPRAESVRELFLESQNRVKSMALIHEKLYQSTDFSNIDFDDYIESLAHNLFHSYAVNPDQIMFTIEVDVELDIDHAIPCGLIVNELLSNSLKHAFPDDRKGTILLRFHQQDHQFVLVFADDGIGLPMDMDFRNTESLGLQLVTTLTGQIGGVIEHLPAAAGTAFQITFVSPRRLDPKEI